MPQLGICFGVALLGAASLLPLNTQAAGRYDGDWSGAPALQANSNPDCPNWKGVRLHVADDRFSQEVGRATMQAAIGPDGSFTTSGNYTLHHQGMQRVEFSGRAAGNQISAVYRTKFCTYNMTLHRQ